MNNTYPLSVEVYLNRARLEAEAGNAAKVGDLLHGGVESHPQSLELISHYAFYCFKTGDLLQAADLFMRRNQLITPDAETCRLLADLYHALHDEEQAKYWSQQAFQLSGSSIHNRIKYWQLLWKSGLKKLYHQWQHQTAWRWIRYGTTALCTQTVIASIWWIEKSFPLLLHLNHATRNVSFSHFLRFIKRYDPNFLHHTLAYHKCREIILTTQCLPAQSNAKVLDIGTGHNPLVLYWAMLGYPVTALDGSLYGYAHLSNVMRTMMNDGHDIQFEYLAGDACRMPIRDDVYDYVTAICAIEHIPDDGDIVCMKEICRVLKPGGKAVVTVETSGHYAENWMIVPYERGYQSGKESADQPDKKWQEVFCRNYRLHEMEERLGNSAQWDIVDIGFYDDFNLPIRSWMDPLKHTVLPKLLQPFVPLLSVLFYRKRSFSPQLTSSSIGYIILQKPAML